MEDKGSRGFATGNKGVITIQIKNHPCVNEKDTLSGQWIKDPKHP